MTGKQFLACMEGKTIETDNATLFDSFKDVTEQTTEE